MSAERKRSLDKDELDEDEILGTKKGKLDDFDKEFDIEHDEDALLLNDDDDDDLLNSDSDEVSTKEVISNGKKIDEKEPEVAKEAEKVDTKKIRHLSTKSSNELNFEDELDYDEDFSDDDETKKRTGRFRTERTDQDVVPKKTTTVGESTKEIPDTLEVTAEVEEKIAKFDEDKKKQRTKKFVPPNTNNGNQKSVAPPVIRYGGPPPIPHLPPHIPAPLNRMPRLAGPPPQLSGGGKILVNPKFRNKINPTVGQNMSVIVPPIYSAPGYSAPPPMYGAPPPGFARPPFPMSVRPPNGQMPPNMGGPPPLMPPRPFK